MCTRVYESLCVLVYTQTHTVSVCTRIHSLCVLVYTQSCAVVIFSILLTVATPYSYTHDCVHSCTHISVSVLAYTLCVYSYTQSRDVYIYICLYIVYIYIYIRESYTCDILIHIDMCIRVHSHVPSYTHRNVPLCVLVCAESCAI